MKKVIFLTFYSKDQTEGIWKKIEAQVKAMRNVGCKVDFFYMGNSSIIHDNGTVEQKIYFNGKSKYFFYYLIGRYIKKNNLKFDFAYIRKPQGGLFVMMLPFLINRINKEARIIMEVPTYPYENEIKGFRLKFLERVFSLMLPFFKRRIDTVTYFGQPTEKIWGIEAVRLSNGVDVSSIKLAEEKVSSGDNELFTVVGVANLSFWHGYDRLILGVKNYCGKRTVIFKIVGDLEPELTRLTSIVKKENLSDKIFFLGRLSGDELDNVFASADVCVDALGRHRSGNDYNSSIKSKEYCARGLPFIKSHIDSAFDDNAFIYQVPSDDTPVNIEDIINWRKSLNPGFSIEERRYAELELTWEKQFQILFSSFE